MVSILTSVNDSPKLYFILRNIYGDFLGILPQDILALTYTVSKISGETKTSITGFTDVEIDKEMCYSVERKPFPATIKGVSDINTGYNLTVFPYKKTTANGVSVWTSPFTDANTTYELVVKITYFMKDYALQGANKITRDIPVRIQTRN